MGTPRPAHPVKLFAGLLSGDVDLLRRARQLLTRRLGPVDLESEVWPFDHTEYYVAEMGPDLRRWFLSFATLVPADQLPEIKLETNAVEAQIAADCLLPDISRPVNIDPGYIDLTKLVLATTKDRGHRIYLGQGIYAEVTLQYAQGAWQTLPWTYADYASPAYHAFFTQLRDNLRQRRRAREAAPGGDGPEAS